ncbi:MAG: dienelactone hydrolase family protein, partial [Acidobacteriota bacterium]
PPCGSSQRRRRLSRMVNIMRKLSGLAIASIGLALGTAPGATSAQAWAKAALDKSPRHGEYVTIPEAGGRKLQAWVVYPEVSQKAPVVVMIHEIFGLSDWAREMADQIAAAGYIVVEPDLLSELGPPSAASASTQMPQGSAGAPYVQVEPGGTAAFPDQDAVVKAVSALPDAQILADLNASADYGKSLPASNGKLNVVGFCWGGGKSFLFATNRHDLSAAFVFYGTPPQAPLMKRITAPVYGFYAGNDARVTATVPQTVIDMRTAGKVYKPVIYPGAGHGFMRAGEAPDADSANAAAQKKGLRRLLRLLRSDG